MQPTGQGKYSTFVFTSLHSKRGHSHTRNKQQHWVYWNSLNSNNNDIDNDNISIGISVNSNCNRLNKILFRKLITNAKKVIKFCVEEQSALKKNQIQLRSKNRTPKKADTNFVFKTNENIFKNGLKRNKNAATTITTTTATQWSNQSMDLHGQVNEGVLAAF